MKHTKTGPRALLLAGALLLSLAAAQRGVGIAPPRFELLLPPGGAATKTVEVFSHDLPDQMIEVAVVDWWLDPRGTVQELPRGANPYSAAPWLQVDQNPFSLSSDTARQVRFSLQLPGGPLAGSYWTAIAFTTKPRPARDANGMAISLRTRVLAIVYVTIPGSEKPAAALQGISIQTGADGGRFVLADVINKGNVYLRLRGELRFVDARGAVVRRLELPERVLLRKGLVRYRLRIPADLPADVVLAAVEILPRGPAESDGGPPLYSEVNLR